MRDSREDAKTRREDWNEENVSAVVVDCGYLRLLKMPLGLLINFGECQDTRVPQCRVGVNQNSAAKRFVENGFSIDPPRASKPSTKPRLPLYGSALF